MFSGPSVDEHHWLPKSLGGRKTSFLHKVCHRALHASLNAQELARDCPTPELARNHPAMQVFLKWVRKRPAEYLDWPKDVRNR